MPRNVYHENNLHFVWRTKVNAPVLVDAVESRCHQYLKMVSNESISLMRRGLKVRDKPVETGSRRPSPYNMLQHVSGIRR